jgi:hypothetical protein
MPENGQPYFNPLALLNMLGVGGMNQSPLPFNNNPWGTPGGNVGYPPGTIPLDPRTGMPIGGGGFTPPTTGGPTPQPGNKGRANRPEGGTTNPNDGKKPGFFDPKTTAIDTTNPHARPIIELIKQFLMRQATRTSDPGGPRAAGPMSQLYPNGVPTASKFNPAPLDPVNAGSTQIRSFQPQYMNQHTANNFDPETLLRSL